MNSPDTFSANWNKLSTIWTFWTHWITFHSWRLISKHCKANKTSFIISAALKSNQTECRMIDKFGGEFQIKCWSFNYWLLVQWRFRLSERFINHFIFSAKFFCYWKFEITRNTQIPLKLSQRLYFWVHRTLAMIYF